MNYILISDLDGTLLQYKNNQYIINDLDLEFIKKINRSNAGFVIASGRHYNDILALIEKYNLKVDFVASNNGGCIWRNSQLLNCIPLSKTEALKFIKEFSNKNCYLSFSDGKTLYIENNTDSFSSDTHKLYSPCHLEDNIYEKAQNCDNIISIGFARSLEKNSNIQENIDWIKKAEVFCLENNFKDMAITFSGHDKSYIDLNNINATKGNALNWLKENYYCDLTTIAVGDALNDYSLLANADLSFRIDSFHQELSDVAHFPISFVHQIDNFLFKNFVGIDFGGTKIKITILSEENKISEHFIVGGTIYQLGKENFIAKLLEINNFIKLHLKHVDFMVCGVPGYNENEITNLLIEECFKSVFNNNHTLVNDVAIAHAGSLALKNGVMFISGTGSNCYAKYNTTTKQVGGWGFLFGDESSGYYLARDLLKRFTKEADGRENQTEIYKTISEINNYTNPKQLISDVYLANDMRYEVSKYGKLAVELADNGNEYMQSVISVAAEEICQHVNATLSIFGDEDIYFSYAGSVIENSIFLQNELKNKLDKKIIFTNKRNDPSFGALLLAMEEKWKKY